MNPENDLGAFEHSSLSSPLSSALSVFDYVYRIIQKMFFIFFTEPPHPTLTLEFDFDLPSHPTTPLPLLLTLSFPLSNSFDLFSLFSHSPRPVFALSRSLHFLSSFFVLDFFMFLHLLIPYSFFSDFHIEMLHLRRLPLLLRISFH